MAKPDTIFDRLGAAASKAERKAWSHLHRHVLIHLPRHREPKGDLPPVVLFVPLARKDIARATLSIAAWKRHSRSRIERVVVAGQEHPDIVAFCKDVGATYINENDVLPASVKEFTYVWNQYNHNGWIRQQMLKLSSDELTQAERIIACDADTRPIRPVTLWRDGKPLLLLSDEYVQTYHSCIDRTIGPVTHHRRSFVAHCMLLEAEVLKSLKAKLAERHGVPWYDAILKCIDTREHAAFASCETYGTFVLNSFPERFQAAYWYNKRIPSLADPVQVAKLEHKAAGFDYVSQHIYQEHLATIEGRKG